MRPAKTALPMLLNLQIWFWLTLQYKKTLVLSGIRMISATHYLKIIHVDLVILQLKSLQPHTTHCVNCTQKAMYLIYPRFFLLQRHKLNYWKEASLSSRLQIHTITLNSAETFISIIDDLKSSIIFLGITIIIHLLRFPPLGSRHGPILANQWNNF